MITTRLMGGMGNQMFQYAMARSLAEKRKTRVRLDITPLQHRLPGRGYLFRSFDLDLFHIDAGITALSRIGKYLNNISFLFARVRQRTLARIRPDKYIIEKNYYFFDPHFLDSPDGCILDGFWQSYKYFSNIQDLLRADFRIKKPLGLDAELLAGKILSSQSVCINVRRADYLSIPENVAGFGVMSMEYFRTGIEKIQRRVENPFFYIFTDDIAWANDNFKNLENCLVVPENCYGDRYIDKFHLMTLCKHFIIPNSTYGWWAAWLSENPDKIVVAPRHWVRDPKLNENTADLIPPEWIRI